MKFMKVFSVLVLTLAAVLTIFTACTDESGVTTSMPDSTVSTNVGDTNTGEKKKVDQKTVDETKKDAGIQPGAKVEEGINEDGDYQFQFSNPDGTGGGGVVLG